MICCLNLRLFYPSNIIFAPNVDIYDGKLTLYPYLNEGIQVTEKFYV